MTSKKAREEISEQVKPTDLERIDGMKEWDEKIQTRYAKMVS